VQLSTEEVGRRRCLRTNGRVQLPATDWDKWRGKEASTVDDLFGGIRPVFASQAPSAPSLHQWVRRGYLLQFKDREVGLWDYRRGKYLSRFAFPPYPANITYRNWNRSSLELNNVTDPAQKCLDPCHDDVRF
jgi:hypothetical protein